MQVYSGVCKGGPWDGKRLDDQTPIREVRTGNVVDTDIAPPVVMGRYVWTDKNSENEWIWESM